MVKMIPISSLGSRIFDLKNGLKPLRGRLGGWTSRDKLFNFFYSIPYWILHLLVKFGVSKTIHIWVSNTNAYGCHPRNFKNLAKIWKSNFQGFVPKFWYPRNQHNLLNHFQFFEIKKIIDIKKLCRFLSPEFNLTIIYMTHGLSFWRWLCIFWL